MKVSFKPVALCLFTLLIFLSANSVFAQQNNLSLTVSPISFDLTTKPGGVIQDRLRIRNNTSQALTLRIDIEKLTSTDTEPGLTLAEPGAGDEFIEWIHFDKPTIVAPPNEWVDIPFTVTVPTHAAFGYYFAFVVTPVRSENDQDGTVALSSSVAVLSALNIQAPGAKAEAQLVEFKPKKFINEWLPADFLVTIRNVGNIHIKPRGNVFIQGGNDKEVALLEVNPSLSNVLPGGQRTFETSWRDGFLVREPVVKDDVVQRDGNGQPITKLKIHWDKLTQIRFGRYTANLLMVFDNGERDMVLESTTTFWVIPYKLIAGLLIGIIIFLFVIRKVVKVYVRRQVRLLQQRK